MFQTTETVLARMYGSECNTSPIIGIKYQPKLKQNMQPKNTNTYYDRERERERSAVARNFEMYSQKLNSNIIGGCGGPTPEKFLIIRLLFSIISDKSSLCTLL